MTGLVAAVWAAAVAVLLAGAIVAWAALRVVSAMATTRGVAGEDDRRRDQAIALVAVFAPGVSAAAESPRALLAWAPLARTARAVSPDAFALLDTAAGGRFPFTDAQIQAAHAKWTTEWLAWERTHDMESKLKTAAAESEMAATGGAPLARVRLDAAERDKLDLYQRRYEEYVRVGKALQALLQAGAGRD